MATENYISKPLLYKLRKVWRYTKLYGPLRTLEKVRGQLHMAKTDGFNNARWENQKCKISNFSQRNVGIIGCGAFSFGNIAYYLQKQYPSCLKGVMDINAAQAKSLAIRHSASYATTEADEIIHDESIKLIYIASNHASHTSYAIRALDAGKHVHIEKPHVVTQGQLDALIKAMLRNPTRKVFLGFNRIRSPLFIDLMQKLKKEDGPAMINWFVAGHEIDDEHWYFSKKEGGRILGNLCHWTDLTLQIVGLENAFPCKVVPVSAKDAKSDFVTSFEFADKSLCAITFSAKGHTFEGVREILNLHKGRILAEIKDFGSLTIVNGADVKRTRPIYRDHGHKVNILNSYSGAILGKGGEASGRYILATAKLFLAAAEAHQTGKVIKIKGLSQITSSSAS